MPKTKEQKQEIIKDLIESLSKQKAMVLLNFGGIDSKELFALRDELKEQDCELKVVKKTLLRKALEKAEAKGLTEKLAELKGQLALIFGFGDEVAPAKICYGHAKDNENLEILGGMFENAFIEQAQVITLAQLPSKQELLGRLVGSLNSPVSRFVYALKGNLSNLVRVLDEIQKVK